jgi:hypothetical protein
MIPAEFCSGMSFEDYDAIEAEGSTALKDMHVSPLLYWWRKTNERPDRDTLRLGRTLHTLILEPERFPLDYVTWTGGRRYGKEWDRFREEHEAQTIITEAQHAAAVAISDAVRAHPVASAILAEEGEAEVSITWTHERTGLRCKARIDWLCSSLTEVKTCRDPAPAMFATAAARIGYHIQLAHYNAALLALGMKPRPIKIIAAQNVEPYDVVVYQVPEEVILVGELRAQLALDRIAACQQTGVWPGLAMDQEVPLHLPSWASHSDDDLGWSVTTSEEGSDAAL